MAEKKKRKDKKTQKKIIISIICVAVILILVGGCWLVHLSAIVLPFSSQAEKSFAIPGIKRGLVPQGLAYDATREIFYVCGYDVKNGPSSLYVISKDNCVKHLYLRYKNGNTFSGHCGGVFCHGKYVYIAGGDDGCLYIIKYKDILDADEYVSFCGRFDTYYDKKNRIRASFIGGNDEHLYVGEYHYTSGYSTPESHHFLYEGYDYGAIMLEYSFDDSARYGISSAPTCAISLPDCVQGMCVDSNGYLFLSISNKFSYSHLLKYDRASLIETTELAYKKTFIPHYIALNASLDILAPPMNEGIMFLDEKIYIISELAARTLFMGKLIGADHCQTLDIAKYYS